MLRRIGLLEIHDSLPSTNDRLLNATATPDTGSLAVCLAGHQSAGKGRGGKKWHSPAGAGLLLSVRRTTPRAPDGSLALALGVAVAEALESFVSATVALKWPNDLVAQDRKLGGILVETSTPAFTPSTTPEESAFNTPQRRDALAPQNFEQGAPKARIVAGLGVNLQISEAQRRSVASEGGMNPISLSELEPRRAPEPNDVAAAMITAMAGVLETHPVDGFRRWEAGWRQRDWLAGRKIEALSGSERHIGVAGGVDSSGALLLKESDGERRILSAEVRA